MTYKTRQAVLRAAADWMDVCNCAGVVASFKYGGVIHSCVNSSFFGDPKYYEFPLALLEGKEVWVGSELWNVPNNFKFTVKYAGAPENYLGRKTLWGGGVGGWLDDLSWNPPTPKTVMVEMLVKDAEKLANSFPYPNAIISVAEACKKALEKL